MNQQVFAAMSGGIDSSVAAYLLREAGYDTTGITMTLYNPNPTGDVSQDVLDARQVCATLGIPHITCHMGEIFKSAVIEDFIATYEAGGTPNPCVVCNKRIKFGALWDEVQAHGGDMIATGHYARVAVDGSGAPLLLKAVDETKDQSYFLWQLKRDVLAHVLFPLGELTKPQIRAMGAELNLPTAHKSDSQDICFVPDGDYAAFMERYTGRIPVGGQFVDEDGRVLGQHKGMIHYTIGQRKGLGIALGTPMFVIGKDPAKNTVTLGSNDKLFARHVYLKDVNLLALDSLTQPLRVCAKIRSTHKGSMATLTPIDQTTALLVFDEAQRGAAMGQSAVFYDGDVVVGGGVITGHMTNGV